MAIVSKDIHTDSQLRGRQPRKAVHAGRVQKIELLESWRDDKEAYMRAAGEGMQGPSRLDALRLIENALISLRGE